MLKSFYEVLVEGPSKNNPELLSGYSEHNKLVNFVAKCRNIMKVPGHRGGGGGTSSDEVSQVGLSEVIHILWHPLV